MGCYNVHVTCMVYFFAHYSGRRRRVKVSALRLFFVIVGVALKYAGVIRIRLGLVTCLGHMHRWRSG